jgi:hypothetical protein
VNDNALVPVDGAALAEKVVVKGDLAGLTAEERMRYYSAVCESLGLNPLTRPFEYITLNGKLTLYATRAAADQLRAVRGITITSLDPRQVGDLFVVVATGRDRSGREDSSTGAVSTAGLRGEALANAMMKAETKAKRRLTLSLAGLGMTDETEVDSIPGAVIPEPPAVLSLAEKAAAKAAEAKVDDAIGMPREAFLAALERAAITPQEAAERGTTLFPGVDPKTYSDAQRADLLLALTDAPSEAMFAEGELEAVMAKIP